ncbi:MAG: hypothetical protein IJQ34_05320 [Kiritimatiellae bacterium]|nr:hypothetical protein [Kiritimatiellia bacterium]
MSIDYIVASLPALSFDSPPGISEEKFLEIAGGKFDKSLAKWQDLSTQLKNAVALARGGAKWARVAKGCSVFWKSRILACFQEKDIAKRDEMLERVFWDAAGELIPPSSPLGEGALAAYYIRLGIATRRAAINRDAGRDAFNKLTDA